MLSLSLWQGEYSHVQSTTESGAKNLRPQWDPGLCQLKSIAPADADPEKEGYRGQIFLLWEALNTEHWK